jgi:hypothetical protein
MDAGAFVYEVGGVRWAEDLGMHDYARLELKGVDLWNSAQNADRWKLFRLGPDGHNILRFEERPQVAGSLATQLEMQTTESGWDFSLDLSPVYSGQAKSVRRTAHLGRRGDLMVRDEWKNALTSPIHWQWITSAEVSLREEGIVLEKDGRQIRLLIRSSHPAEVTIQNAEDLLHPKEDPLPCIRRIRITLPEAADSGWIEVRASEQTPSANPLSR